MLLKYVFYWMMLIVLSLFFKKLMIFIDLKPHFWEKAKKSYLISKPIW